MRDTSIDRIMTINPVMIGPGDSAAKARELLETSAIHHLPVVENGRLVGIVSSADLLKLYVLDQEVALSALATVSQIMELKPVVLTTTATLRDAAEKLMSGGFHALPVVDDDRNLVGIVTSVDLIDALLKSLPVGDGSIVQAPEHSLSDLMEDNRLMQQACDAAELYVRSGHAEHEHSALIKCLADLRRHKESVDV